MLEALQLWFYQLETAATHLVEIQLQHPSLLSGGIVYGAGLATSLSPCMVSMLPITVGYFGGYEEQNGEQSRWKSAFHALVFAAGLAITLTGLGLAAALLGRLYGQLGVIPTMLMGGVAILMGLNLLQVVPLSFPNWFGDMEFTKQWPASLRALALGLTFGLVASPCSTPVLVALLGWVSTTGNPTLGSVLLFAYAAGMVTPLVLAGTFTAALKNLLSVRRWSGWVTTASGALLIGFGTFSILTRLS